MYIILAVLWMFSGSLSEADSQEAGDETVENKMLLAVFAHPDDEMVASPILARYAREGANVILVVATDGRLGVREFAGYEAGDELAAVRRDELKCAADVLGIDLIHLEYEDQLGISDGHNILRDQTRGFKRDLHEIIDTKEPDAIITFGPDGITNHMDHRLIGIAVTQVVLSKKRERMPSLFYVGFPASRVGDDWMYTGVDDAFLTVRVPFSDRDLEAGRKAAQCHESQLLPEFIEGVFSTYRDWGNVIHLRPFEAPKHRSDDLFNYPSQHPFINGK